MHQPEPPFDEPFDHVVTGAISQANACDHFGLFSFGNAPWADTGGKEFEMLEGRPRFLKHVLALFKKGGVGFFFGRGIGGAVFALYESFSGGVVFGGGGVGGRFVGFFFFFFLRKFFFRRGGCSRA